MLEAAAEPTLAQDLVIAILIFLGGLLYISLDTLRILFVNRGLRMLATLLGFLEVIVFLLAVSQVLSGPLSLLRMLAYAGGFAAGTLIGMLIESRMAMGHLLARVITQVDAEELALALRNRKFGITTIAAQGLDGDVRILFAVISRKAMEDFIATVQEFNPNAFVTFEDVRSVRAGYVPPPSLPQTWRWEQNRPEP